VGRCGVEESSRGFLLDSNGPKGSITKKGDMAELTVNKDDERGKRKRSLVCLRWMCRGVGLLLSLDLLNGQPSYDLLVTAGAMSESNRIMNGAQL